MKEYSYKGKYFDPTTKRREEHACQRDGLFEPVGIKEGNQYSRPTNCKEGAGAWHDTRTHTKKLVNQILPWGTNN